MLINLKLICRNYLHDVLIDTPYERSTRCREMYGGLEHGRTLIIDKEEGGGACLFTYVRGVKHGKCYCYPFGFTLADTINGKCLSASNNYLEYANYKHNKMHGRWRIVRWGSYENRLYRNGTLLKIKMYDNAGVLVESRFYEDTRRNEIIKRYTFHKNGRVKLYQQYIGNGSYKYAEYDEHGVKLHKK